MATKICPKCLDDKDRSLFPKDRSRGGDSGVKSLCKECTREKNKQMLRDYRRSLIGWAKNHWANINRRCVNGSHPQRSNKSTLHYLMKGIMLQMSEQEFMDWVAARWSEVEALWNLGEVPSIDRKDPDDHYYIENLQIISNRINCLKGSIRAGQVMKERYRRNHELLCVSV